MTLRRLCIVGLDDYPLLAGRDQSAYVGGESVQHLLLARAWRDLGLDVSVIVYDCGQGADRQYDGIRALKAFRKDAGAPVLRFAHPRLTGLVAALRKADADLYYQSPAGAYTGVTAWFCRKYGRRFVFRVASDANCIPGQQLIRFWRDRKLYEYGLRRADLIAAQTEHQRRVLLQNYGLESALVNLAVAPPQPDTRSGGARRPQTIDVLWVSNLRSVKRPELAVELARRLPRYRFVMAGGPLPGQGAYYEQMKRAATDVQNITWLGAVPYSSIGRLFDRTRVFVNTSSLEGFPNTFLQAWIRSVPVITFFDPDQLVERHQLGRTVTSLDAMTEALDTLLTDPAQARSLGERARRFALAEYSASQVAGRYLELLAAEPRPLIRDGTWG